jgi:hypothetical protein
VSGTLGAVKRLELGVAVVAGGIKQGRPGALFSVLMEGGSLQVCLACRGNGTLVPVNERIGVLSDVARSDLPALRGVCHSP